jgi:hypothetical protein
MELKPINKASQGLVCFPGYLFFQFIVKQRDSGEDLAILSVLEKTAVEADMESIKNHTNDYSDYISELSVYDSDHFFEILRGIHDVSIDIFNIEFSSLFHAVIPFKQDEEEILGTLSEKDDESGILWSLVKIK